jgi:drug/metabolite transporter (DMT)-like permease
VTAGVAIGLAIACVAAAATSLGWLMKSRGARASATMRHDRPWRSLRALFASRWFAGGVLVASVGGLLHIAALALAPISTVQAVMASGIVLLGVMAERLFGWPVPTRQRAGVLLTGLGLLLLALSVPHLRGAHSSFHAPAMVAFDVALLAASGLLLLAPRLKGLRAHDGALIGAASGALFGLSDIAVKAVLGVAGHGTAAVLLSPWLAVAVLGGLIAQYVSARSLQTGDAVSVTALTGVAVNVANIAGGIVIFGDPLAHGLAGSLGEVAAFAAICAGAFLTPVRAATVPPTPRQRGSNRPAEPLPPSQAPVHAKDRAPVTVRRGNARDDASASSNVGALASAAATLLIASKLADLLEPELGFDIFNLVLAFAVAFMLVGFGLVLGYDLLQTRALRSHAPSPATTTALLLVFGTGALVLIGVEHLDQPPSVDGWLGIAGGLLMLVAGLANRHRLHPRQQVVRVRRRSA